jgi:Tfp pilus assembly protein PilP
MDDPFKYPNPYANNQNKPTQKPAQKTNNFLEAFKDQGKAATLGVAQNAVDQIFGTQSIQNSDPRPLLNSPDTTKTPAQPFNFAEFLKMREQRIRQQERMLSQQQRHTETVLFHQKEEKAKQEIEAIKLEIKKIIETAQSMSAEVKAAQYTVMAQTVEAGTYQVNFFERVLRLLVYIRKHLADSKNWLETFNGRKANKSFYWGQVGKSGAKYMLSHERYMATQAG